MNNWRENSRTEIIKNDDGTKTYITRYDKDYIECPKCKKSFNIKENDVKQFNFCPNCGSHIMGEDVPKIPNTYVDYKKFRESLNYHFKHIKQDWEEKDVSTELLQGFIDLCFFNLELCIIEINGEVY